MSASSRGIATRSGGCEKSRCRPRHTSRNDLPYVWPARSYGIGRCTAPRASWRRRNARRAQVDLGDRRRGDGLAGFRTETGRDRRADLRLLLARRTGALDAPTPERAASPARRVQVVAHCGVALVDEGLAKLVAVAPQVELEGEALLEAVRAFHVDRVDHVERFLGAPHHDRALLRDDGRELERGVEQLRARHDAFDGAEREQLRRGDHRAHEEHRAELVLRHEPREVRGDAERAAVDLGQAERRVVGRDDDVGVPCEADPAAEAEALHRRDHGDLAVVDRGERFVAAAVHLDERFVRRVGRELLDVDTRLESLALRAEDHDAHVVIAAGGPQRVGETEPARDRQCVHRRIVDRDDLDVFAALGADHRPETT